MIEDLTSRHIPLCKDAKLDVPEQIRFHGFEWEDFNVTTEDGYINNLWHVWSKNVTKKIDKTTGKQKVFFLQHGLIDIAGTWFFETPDKSVAY